MCNLSTGDAGTTEEAGLVPAAPDINPEGGRAGISELLQRRHVSDTYTRAATDEVGLQVLARLSTTKQYSPLGDRRPSGPRQKQHSLLLSRSRLGRIACTAHHA